jgi:ribosomal protein L7/L12
VARDVLRDHPVAVAAAGAAAAPAEEKTSFNVELKDVGASKIEVIKVVRDVTAKGLKESKDLVDAAATGPQVVKENAKNIRLYPDPDAAELREALQGRGEENIKAKEVSKKHFDEALKKVKASITDDVFVKYQKAVEELRKTKVAEKPQDVRYIG